MGFDVGNILNKEFVFVGLLLLEYVLSFMFIDIFDSLDIVDFGFDEILNFK